MNLNLLVLRVADLERTQALYESLGLSFSLEQHGRGPQHLAAVISGFVFELYPLSDHPPSSGARVGFSLADIEGVVVRWQQLGGEIVTAPRDTEWGRRAVLADYDGHRIEILGDA